MDGKYHILYKAVIKREGFTKEECQAVNDELFASTDYGATDALFIVSVIKRNDGGRSYSFPSLDGTTGEEIVIDDLFRIWAVMAHSLSESEDLGPGRKGLCKHVHEIVKDAFTEHKLDTIEEEH